MIHTVSLAGRGKGAQRGYNGRGSSPVAIGPVVRIGPTDLSFDTVTAFDSIYGFGGDQHFSLHGSRKGLLGSLAGMGSSLSNSTRREQRRLLRPLITTTLTELTATSTERYCNIALSENLRAHSVGQTGATPISLSTLYDRCLWQLGTMVAFGNRSSEMARGVYRVLRLEPGMVRPGPY